MDDLIPIGRFARLSGLSVGALRHYDELDLVRPADVDPFTSYRRYRPSQLEAARTIARLRELELPLEDIRTVLAADDPVDRLRVLSAHRSRIEARTYRLQRILHRVSQLAQGKEPVMSQQPAAPDLDVTIRRSLAVALFNHVWTLLETANRTAEQDDEMVHAAHASRYHWGEVGEAKNVAIGEWQCSRVYAVLGRGEPALHHARRCLAAVESHDAERWLRASAFEALARAHAVAGEREAAAGWKARATAAVAEIEDADERAVVQQDVASLPI